LTEAREETEDDQDRKKDLRNETHRVLHKECSFSDLSPKRGGGYVPSQKALGI